ncbi:MAG: MmgE/PrpD family protein [Rhodovulum sp.]|nr:MmgE/PrpD family protein [Rhodovulum sp.]
MSSTALAPTATPAAAPAAVPAPAAYTDELAAFAAALTPAAIPEPVRRHARLVLLDTVGAIVAGTREAEIAALATALRAGSAAAPAQLAFVLGTAGVAIELDEGCAPSRGHPGVHVVPALLAAMAAGHEADADTLLTALVAGYEVAARLGSATTFRDGIHPHGTWGACGAAAALGRLAGLPAPMIATAIRAAASLSVATDYQTVHAGALVRNAWSGMAGFAGTMAVELARAGFSAAADAPAGVFGRVLGTGFDRAAATDGLGHRWLICENYFKPYACCRHTHASVAALEQAVDGVAPDAIVAVRAFTYARAVAATGALRPQLTPLAAKFSLPDIVAARLLHGGLGDDAFREPVLSRRDIAALAERVTVADDPALSALFPGVRAARVEVDLADGSTRTAEAHGSHGDPQDPMSEDEVRAKFLRLAGPSLGAETATALAAGLLAAAASPAITPAELARQVASLVTGPKAA